MQQPAQNSAQSDVANPNNHLGNHSTLMGILISDGLLNQQQITDINNEQIKTGKTAEEILKEKNFVSEEDLTRSLAKHNNIPFIKISETGISPTALSKISEGVAKRYKMLPFAYNDSENLLLVAMEDPLDLPAVGFVEQKTGHRIQAHYAMPSELNEKITERYAQNISADVTQALQGSVQYAPKKRKAIVNKSQTVLREAPITRIVDTILGYAVKSNTSDVHIEPQESRTRVRYRIDGILHEKLILPKNVHDALTSRIKILCDMKLDEKRVPQDGRFSYEGDEGEVDLRVSSLPTIHGEKIVMRLLKKNADIPALKDLGLSGLALSNFKEAIQVPTGIILVTGPTGSGKTTTLYSALHTINEPTVNIMTLEDPVEYEMPGISQVQVNNQAGLTFASGLRSFLRQDPDIMMVGEIRDKETAGLAVQASLTGHLVFSTLHTNSAGGALPRLMDMGIEPFLLSSSITLVMAQRVVRKLTPQYKEEYKPNQAVLNDIRQVLGDDLLQMWLDKVGKKYEDITLFRAKADRPNDTKEYSGRIGIFEVMKLTDEIAQMILQRKPGKDMERAALKQGMMLMKQDGYIKALEGITTIEEVLRVAEVA